MSKLASDLVSALHLMGSLNDVIRDTHGNISCVDRLNDVMWIKPSGMSYCDITLDDICGITLSNGVPLPDNKRKPSVDTEHHRTIYNNHGWVDSICHTHSPYVVAHAINSYEILCATTEQADYFGDDVRVLPYRDLNSWGDYVSLRPGERAVVLGKHGGLTFSKTPENAVKLAAALENVAQKNMLAIKHSGGYIPRMETDEIKKWFLRYNNVYGQK